MLGGVDVSHYVELFGASPVDGVFNHFKTRAQNAESHCRKQTVVFGRGVC